MIPENLYIFLVVSYPPPPPHPDERTNTDSVRCTPSVPNTQSSLNAQTYIHLTFMLQVFYLYNVSLVHLFPLSETLSLNHSS